MTHITAILVPDSSGPPNGMLGPLLHFDARCRCESGGRKLPFRGVAHGVDTLRGVVNTRLNPDLAVLTYHCRDCNTVVVLTLRDLGVCS